MNNEVALRRMHVYQEKIEKLNKKRMKREKFKHLLKEKRLPVEKDRGTKKMTIEDVIKKTILPLAFMVFWFWVTKTIIRVSGETDLFWWIFLSGLPFGIYKMRLILIPQGMDTTATLGMAALSVIIGALIGSFMIPVYVVRALYVLIRYIVGK